MPHSDSKRRLENMIAGWYANLDTLAHHNPDHADKYYAEGDRVYCLHHLLLDLPDGNDLAVAGFIADHVLPLLLEGK